MNELNKEATITITKRDMIFKLKRTDIIVADPTFDGMMFQLQNGLILQYTDSFMPSEAKQLISNSISSFPGANLAVSLDNYRKPVVATPVNQ